MKKDLVIGIIGTVILVAAMVGVFRYEASRGGGSSFFVSWDEGPEAGPMEEGRTQAGATTPLEIELLATNVTRIEWVLAWTDDVGDPDTFSLTVTAPNGTNYTAEGSSGMVRVAVEDLATVPASLRLLAASGAEAEARLAREWTDRAAQGTWGVAVRLVSAPGVRAPVTGTEVQPDGANAWSLAANLTVYRPTIEAG